MRGEAAKIFEAAGAAAITVHGRTRNEFYSGSSDLSMIKLVKESVHIPIIGNGDVKTIENAQEMFEKTNVDGIMIGRGALGNPWIFRNIICGLNGEKVQEVTNKEKLQVILKHIELAVNEKGENTAIKEMRKHISAYIKNTKGASSIRDKVNKISTEKELRACLTEYFETI